MSVIKKLIGIFVISLSLIFISCGPNNNNSFKPYEGNAKECANLRIYQIMVSCFQDGDPSIGFTTHYGPNDAMTCGDLQGVIDSIDYIKGLGCNAIWMTPIFDSSSAQSLEGEHQSEKLDSTGYFAYDFFNIDPQFGTKETFKNLVDKCHENGVYVFLDGVFGHWNWNGVKASPSGKLPQRSYDPGDGCDYPESLEFFKEVATYWIKNYDVDGYRLDQCYQTGVTGYNVHTNGHNYWYEIRNAVKEACAENLAEGKQWGTLGYMVGECWENTVESIQQQVINPGTADGYGLNSCFDFPSRYWLVNAIAREERFSYYVYFSEAVSQIYKSWTKKGYYHPDTYLPNLFISNHDTVRFGDLINWRYGTDNYWDRVKLGFAILAGYSGPITIYYGDEWGSKTNLTPVATKYFNGPFMNDSYLDNCGRTTGKTKDFTNDENDLITYVSKLMQIRDEHEALWNGEVVELETKNNYLYACKKVDSTGNDVVYILMNNCGNSLNYKIGKPGKNLIDDTNTGVTVTIPPYTAMFITLN